MADSGGGSSGGSDAIGAAAGVAGLLPAFIGRGQNTQLAKGFVGQPGYDKNAAFFGGSKNGLRDYTNRLQQQQQQVDARGPALAATSAANYTRANTWEQQQAQARQGQQTLAQAQMARALGQTPSIAQMQADRQMQQAAAAQGGQQASARGAAGLALAGQAAAGNTANAQSSIAGQAQINGDQERMAAEGAAQSAYGNIRGGDAQAQQQAAQQAQFSAQHAAQQSQFNAGQTQTNRDSNDARSMGYEQLGFNARNAELGARTQNQATLAGAQSAATSANQKSADQNAGSKGLIQTIGDLPSVLSDERAKTPLLLMGGAPRRPDEAMPAMGPGSGGAVPSYEVLNSGGEDVAASGRAMSNFATKYATNPQSGPSMMSDERAKKPLLARGIRPKYESGSPPPAPRMMFDPSRGWVSQPEMSDSESSAYNGWRGKAPDTAHLRADWEEGEQKALADQRRSPINDIGDDEDVAKRVAEVQERDARSANDPAVGLDRIQRDRGMIKRGTTPSNDNAQADADKGLAPGTTDFESTQPKEDPGPGKRPWWAALGNASDTLNRAQFGDTRRGPMLSDERAKRAYYTLGRQDGADQVRGGEPIPYAIGGPPTEDEEFVVGKNGPEFRQSAKGLDKDLSRRVHAAVTARDTGSMFDRDAQYMSNKPKPAPNIGSIDRDDAYLPKGGDSPIAAANRTMVGSAYAYKDGLTPPDQQPGEPNFGPMAQNLEKNPITATAVKTDPATGLKTIDRDKALKVTMSGLADLQHQNDNIKMMLAAGGRSRQ